MKLKSYHELRNFKKSPEPKGKIFLGKGHKKLFVIQKHAASHLHYDFRLELNGVLISWAIPKGPCLDPSVKRLAVHVEDHPIEYGNFEGIIPKGQYGGGTVMLWDKGEWISEDKDPDFAYSKGNMTFTIKAEKLNGKWKLIRINRNDKTWLLIKIKDEYARSMNKYDVTVEEPNSILSHLPIDKIADEYNQIWSKTGLKSVNKSIKKIKKIKLNLRSSKYPENIHPELATLIDEPPEGDNWLHEIKFDGYRILAYKQNNDIKMITRNGNDWTNKFKSISDKIRKLNLPNIIFDGEIVVLDDQQHSDFQLLQNAIKNPAKHPFIYYIFDLLYYDKYNLMSLPLLKRKSILEKLLKSINENTLRYSDHIIGSGEKILKNACELALEGIVSKEINSVYEQKRTREWLKIKCSKRQEFIIGGFTAPKNSRKYFGSLLLGTLNKRNELIYNGNVGTGFSESSLKDVYQTLIKNKAKKNPFNTKIPNNSKVTWIKPILVVEVEFSEWTKDNYLRHPSFKGLRKDKPEKEVVKETEIPVENIVNNKKSYKLTKIKLTNPDKILYKEDKISKLQLAEYYESIKTWILPYLINRPLVFLRCPDGYNKCFFQKHLDRQHPSALYQIAIIEKHNKENYSYIVDEEGLLAIPQLGILEIHPWNCTIDSIEYPNQLVFDLDPGEDVAWKKIVAAAFEMKKQLSQFKLKSFVKTTGGKGLHVVVPIKPEYEWSEVKNFAKVFSEYMVMQNPKDYLSKMTKSKRSGKIYIDFLRNQRGATAIAPYSTRARIHAPIATPLAWDELTNDKSDIVFTLKTLPTRLQSLKNDPWKDFFKTRQTLNLDKYK